jgi:hypothetical protein
MNIIISLFDKNDGSFVGHKKEIMPSYFLSNLQDETFYLEPDTLLCELFPDFSKYDCIVEVA